MSIKIENLQSLERDLQDLTDEETLMIGGGFNAEKGFKIDNTISALEGSSSIGEILLGSGVC